MSASPLLHGFEGESTFAYCSDGVRTAEAFLHHAATLANRLPERGFVLNLCGDRYRFAVGFAAALTRMQASLLPPNHTKDTISRLRREYRGLYCLTDGPAPEDIETVTVDLDDTPRHRRGAFRAPAFPIDQVAAIAFTSGSTGDPVPYVKTWGALVTSAHAESFRLGLNDGLLRSLVGTVPPQHMYGLESTVMLALQGGIAMHAGHPFYPADVCAALASLPRPRALVTTPFHLRAILAEGSLPSADQLLCATAPLNQQVAAEAEAGFGAVLHEIYGCTEAGQIATRRSACAAEWTPLAGIKLFRRNDEAWVESAHVGCAYRLNDVVDIRDDGRFYLEGRTADVINIAGKRTSLAHLNYHLNAIVGVRDGVFIAPATDRGTHIDRLAALVVAERGVTAQHVLEALRRRIDEVFLPRPLRLVAALPRNSTGKLPRRALEEAARTSLAESETDEIVRARFSA